MTIKFSSLLLLLIGLISVASVEQDHSMFDSLSEMLAEGFLNNDNADAPKVEFPSEFTMRVITDTAIYNSSVSMRIDSQKNRIWTKADYTSPLWGDYEAFQMALFPSTKIASLKINDECRSSVVKDIGYLYLNLILKSWGYYTKYDGLDDEGLHQFEFIKSVQKTAKNVTFHFKDMGQGKHVQLAKIKLNPAGLVLTVAEPPTEATFQDSGMFIITLFRLCFWRS